MDYEKKYKEALDRASHIKDHNTIGTPQEIAKLIFPELSKPELTEFEDKLRKCMIIAGATYMSDNDLTKYVKQHKEELLDAAKKELEQQGYYFYQKLEHTITCITDRITDITAVSNPDDPGFNYTKD